MSTLALIALGSNLGDREAHLDSAVAALAAIPETTLEKVSTYHGTAAVGGPPGQATFRNAAASLSTDLDPLDLLHELQRIEQEAGRVRTVRWGTRSLDLDLLLYGDRIIDTGRVHNRVYGGYSEGLIVPHPRMPFRRFVLAPLSEVAPEAVDPLTGRTVSELLANIDRRPGCFALHDPRQQFPENLIPAICSLLTTRVIVCGTAPSGVFLPPPEDPEELAELSPKKRVELQSLALDRGRLAAIDFDINQTWLITNFWFDANFDSSHLTEPDRSQFLAKRRDVLEPTFVVAPPGYRRSHARGSPEWGMHSFLGSTPILEAPLDSLDNCVKEILAACLASRDGR